jgi:hypothetical protein
MVEHPLCIGVTAPPGRFPLVRAELAAREITTPSVTCPFGGSGAWPVHNLYNRRLADLPCFGRAVRLQLASGQPVAFTLGALGE